MADKISLNDLERCRSFRYRRAVRAGDYIFTPSSIRLTRPGGSSDWTRRRTRSVRR